MLLYCTYASNERTNLNEITTHLCVLLYLGTRKRALILKLYTVGTTFATFTAYQTLKVKFTGFHRVRSVSFLFIYWFIYLFQFYFFRIIFCNYYKKCIFFFFLEISFSFLLLYVKLYKGTSSYYYFLKE